MTFESWLFSAKRAWQDPWVRGVTLCTVFVVVVASLWFSVQVIALRHTTQGLLVLHYNVYFGIDAIKHWAWMLLLPATWVLCTLVDVLWVFGVYRADAYQAWSLLSIALLWSIPWMMTLWHLVGINH